jgi:hypothetical protein
MLMLGIWAFWLEPASLNNEAYEIVCTSEARDLIQTPLGTYVVTRNNLVREIGSGSDVKFTAYSRNLTRYFALADGLSNAIRITINS